MSAPPDPPRLVDGAPEPLRGMLAAGRADGPSADQLARIAARAAKLGAPPAGGAPPSPAWFGPAAKVGLASIAVGLAAGGFALRGETRVAASQAASSASVVAIASAPPAAPEASIDAPPEASIKAPPEASINAPPPAPSPPLPPSHKPPPPRREPLGAAVASAAPEPPSEPEVALVARAHRALSSSPATALTLCDEHQARFAHGELAPEREVIAIGALAALGRRDDARARADRFRASHPGSAYLRRIEVVLSR